MLSYLNPYICIHNHVSIPNVKMHLQLPESRGIRKWKKDFSISLLHMGCKVTFWAGRTSSKLFLFPWLTKLYSLTVRLDRLFRQLDSNFLPQGQNLIISIEEIFQMILTSVCLPNNDPITSIDELQNSSLSILFSLMKLKGLNFHYKQCGYLGGNP